METYNQVVSNSNIVNWDLFDVIIGECKNPAESRIIIPESQIKQEKNKRETMEEIFEKFRFREYSNILSSAVLVQERRNETCVIVHIGYSDINIEVYSNGYYLDSVKDHINIDGNSLLKYANKQLLNKW